jgi:uncharacterized protein (DUF305 family)
MLKTATWLIATLVAVIALVAISGCGDDGGDAAVETDGAFVAEMTAHHEAAIAMAELAGERAEHPEIRQRADEIVGAQGEEIAAMEDMHQRMFGEAMSEADHGTLGMAPHEMGMDMDMTELEAARPFDSAFIVAMSARHQGAIRMARVELERGSDDQVRNLAEAIIAAQSREIEQMNAWHERWYGSPAQAGGVPDMDMSMPADDGMGH